ncbi:entericidin A/B family lipoprotein [Parvibaculum sp.]|nr:entericidin A/B family lipoprotein [Parvibaculum sp.]MDP1626160.1 entericidin A/B family lipoprotein [Parvibaculum sp.]MDP1776119.1 entericidin A/B family lipoprotein [Moraxellaceae bacterium]MDP2151477.1 entericidin A/B family lipoprotein [Parvibaculum sp.]MDP3329193.1 entericidin A/B family lipoprotein [Parvibaculum sp.]
MNKIFAVLALLVAGIGLSACNTVEGAGQDIQRGGAAIEDTANDAK